MITEDYVSFEMAKLLKEKGFDGECRDYYNTDGHFYSEDFKSDWNNNKVEITLFSAPTLQMAMKWLREIHNIQIQIAPIMPNPKNWTFGIYKDFNLISSKLQCFDTYEQTVEETIKYCLKNLI